LLYYWNAAPIPREQLDTVLFALIDILVVDEVEAAALAQASVASPKEAQVAAEQLLSWGPLHVIITLGSQGCVWSTRQEEQIAHQFLSTFSVKAVDATAAGPNA
jgi:ribokinase